MPSYETASSCDRANITTIPGWVMIPKRYCDLKLVDASWKHLDCSVNIEKAQSILMVNNLTAFQNRTLFAGSIPAHSSNVIY